MLFLQTKDLRRLPLYSIRSEVTTSTKHHMVVWFVLMKFGKLAGLLGSLMAGATPSGS